MCALYRGEKWEVTYGIETSYGEAPTALTTATNVFGMFDTATLPDPTFEYQPFWAMNPEARNYYVAYKGRAVSAGSIPDIVLLDGRPIFLPFTNTIAHTGETAPYTHTINDGITLPSFRIAAVNYSNDDSSPTNLIRWFVGGKVNRATFRCDAGGMLRMSLEDMPFKMPYFKDNGANSDITPWYDSDLAAQTFTYPCTEPYYFSQGLIKWKVPYLGLTEVTIPSVRSFSLDVNNRLEPKYYVTTNTEKVPYEIFEGRREYRLSLQVDLVDSGSFSKDSPFLELLNQGMNSTAFTGSGMQITFTRGADDYIKFTTPSDYTPASCAEEQGTLLISAGMPIVTEGVIPVTLNMTCRNMEVEIKDSLAGTSYPV